LAAQRVLFDLKSSNNRDFSAFAILFFEEANGVHCGQQRLKPYPSYGLLLARLANNGHHLVLEPVQAGFKL
jgi:hypothetical protein